MALPIFKYVINFGNDKYLGHEIYYHTPDYTQSASGIVLDWVRNLVPRFNEVDLTDAVFFDKPLKSWLDDEVKILSKWYPNCHIEKIQLVSHGKVPPYHEC